RRVPGSDHDVARRIAGLARDSVVGGGRDDEIHGPTARRGVARRLAPPGGPPAHRGRAKILVVTTAARAVRHWIGGKVWDGAAARTGEVFDPSTGAVQAEVALAGPAEIDAAVQSARQAFAEWRDVPLARRARHLFAFREGLERRKDELAEVISA